MWWFGIWVGCAGCAQLFGLPDTAGNGDAGDVAKLDIVRRSIGATVVTGPQDLTDLTATFYFHGADPNVLQSVMGTPTGTSWTADASGPPIVVFTLPDYPRPTIHGVELGSRAIQVGYDVLEHPSPVPAAAGATITAQATLPTPYMANESLVFFAVGAWSFYTISTGLPVVGTTAVNVSFPYGSATSATGRPLEKFTADDRVLLLRYLGSSLTGAGEIAMDQSDTTTTVAFGAMTAVSPTTTGSVTIDPVGIASRFAATVPAATSGPSISWDLYAAVAPAEPVGVSLQGGSVAMTDTAIGLAYGDPFTSPAWPPELAVTATVARTFTPSAPPLPVTLYAQLEQLADPTSPVDFAGGLPTSVTINGSALTRDGDTVTIDPTKAVSVAVACDRSTDTLYRIQLFALVPSTDNTSLVYQSQFGFTSTTATFSVPPELFPDGLYTLRATCIASGSPNAATGDLATFAFPVAQGSLDSGVFTAIH
jgi:hypothetical protein